MNTTLTSEAMAPEALDAGNGLAMGEQEPEAKDRLGKDIEHSVAYDLGIDVPLSCSVSNTPDNGVQRPEDKGEGSNGSKESGDSIALGGSSTATTHSEDEDDEDVGNAGHCVPAPSNSLLGCEGGEESGENHDDVCNDGNKDVSSRHSG